MAAVCGGGGYVLGGLRSDAAFSALRGLDSGCFHACAEWTGISAGGLAYRLLDAQRYGVLREKSRIRRAGYAG